MRGEALADLRNLYRAELAREAGLRYVSGGRSKKLASAMASGR
jgi:hypothetical protein